MSNNKDKSTIIDESSKKLNKSPKKVLKSDDTQDIKKNVEFNLIEVIMIILMTGIIVSIISSVIVYNNYDKLNNNSVSTNHNRSDLYEFEENYNKIMNNYVEKVDKDKLLDAAIEGMYNYLGDKYSIYISKDNSSSFEETLEGEYTGIGVEITSLYNDKETLIIITKVFKDSPADKAGLKVNDILISLDDVKLDGKDASYVANTIKYGTEPKHKLVVKRNNENIEINIERSYVFINSVHSDVFDNKIGYIKLDTFSTTTTNQVKKAIDSFDNKVNSLIIDVRDNSGGYLNVVHDVASLFIEKDKNIYQMKDRNNNITKYKSTTDIYRKFDKIVVLINGRSASASEILALALKESAGAQLVGEKSYGKGSVQETEILKSGAMVKYTTAYWLSPNGNSINEKGIVPDIIEENPNKQIEKAIEAVK